MYTATLELDKKAKGKGGDRYAGRIAGEEVKIYFPQSISRPKGAAPTQKLKLSVEEVK